MMLCRPARRSNGFNEKLRGALLPRNFDIQRHSRPFAEERHHYG